HAYACGGHLTCFLVCHNALRCCCDQDSDISGGEVSFAPLLVFYYGGRESGTDAAAVVDPAEELDLELSAAAVVYELELAYIAVFLHHPQYLSHELRGGVNDAVVFVPPLVVEYG